jgi:hypothetical protein
MFVMNWGCSPHFKQRGEVGFWRSCFSMPHRMSGRPYRQVKKRRHYWGGYRPRWGLQRALELGKDDAWTKCCLQLNCRN